MAFVAQRLRMGPCTHGHWGMALPPPRSAATRQRPDGVATRRYQQLPQPVATPNTIRSAVQFLFYFSCFEKLGVLFNY